MRIFNLGVILAAIVIIWLATTWTAFEKSLAITS
jgi:hypothetical protein